MREFKFRAYSKQLGRMMSWDEVERDIQIYTNGLDMSFELDCDTDDITVVQYTGFKDKTGIEIYEGDVVRYYGFIVKEGKQVRPAQFIEATMIMPLYHRLYCIVSNHPTEIKNIGNIYENPELING